MASDEVAALQRWARSPEVRRLLREVLELHAQQGKQLERLTAIVAELAGHRAGRDGPIVPPARRGR